MNVLSEAGAGPQNIAREQQANVPDRGVQRLNPLREPGWDKRVMSHRGASFFHSASWAGVLRDTYGHAPHYFCVRDGNRLSAVLPVMEVRSPLTGRRGVSLPFTDECQFLSDGATPAEEVFREVIDFGQKQNWRYVECRGAKPLAKAASPSLSFYGHVLPLAAREERMFARLEGKARTGIRKAEKSKVRVEISRTMEGMRAFYSLHCKTRKKHGLPPQSISFFRNIARHVLSQDLGFVVLGTHQGKPIAAAVFFHLNDQATLKYAASEAAFNQLCGNSLILWEAIKWYSAKGFTALHLGRGSIANEGLRRFKLSFGSEEYKIDYFRYDLRKKTFVTDRDKVFGWFNGAFRLMPIRMSRIFGSLLYRHLS